MPVIEYDGPDRFVVGTVGQPGQRTFFLQAAQGRRVTSVSLEKQQAQVLAERVDELLDVVPAALQRPPAEQDNEPLAGPIEDEFRVSTLSLAWDEGARQVVIECYDEQAEPAAGESGAEPDGTGSVLTVRLSPPAAREFVRRTLATVAQGRPPCPFCGGPLDAQGHVCPRANGYRR